MTCINCGGKTKVVNVAKDTDEKIRLRECTVCKTRFYTAERIIDFNEGHVAVNQIRNYIRHKNRERKETE